MGSSKPREVSNAGRQLLKEHGSEFSRDFSANARTVSSYLTCNKPMRNEIAGFISAEMRKKESKKIR